MIKNFQLLIHQVLDSVELNEKAFLTGESCTKVYLANGILRINSTSYFRILGLLDLCSAFSKQSCNKSFNLISTSFRFFKQTPLLISTSVFWPHNLASDFDTKDCETETPFSRTRHCHFFLIFRTYITFLLSFAITVRSLCYLRK